MEEVKTLEIEQNESSKSKEVIKSTFPVIGMSCASCALHVTR